MTASMLFSVAFLCVRAQLCLTLCDIVDCSLPDSSAHGIFQARILEWVAISFSRGSSVPREWTHISSTSPALQMDSLLLSPWEAHSSCSLYHLISSRLSKLCLINSEWAVLNCFKKHLVSNIYHENNDNNNISNLKYPLSDVFSVNTKAL